MIKSVKEIASSSNIPAPIFRFRDYVRGQRYYNDGQEIDFVTDGRSLYVPATDSTIPEPKFEHKGHHHHHDCEPIVPERGVVAKADNIKDDDQFMLIISQGPQGIQGVQGKPGKDGKTPSVFARFDGKQMVFYTMEDIDGIPTTKRIAATNDLTGPAWKPKVINDTIVWEKSKDDETPQSIPLDELRAKEAPVLLRVNSDNTKREDETSGPANYIQWKYEGEDYWNNLISISELMNLTLAGVTIFPVQNEETGNVEYHLGHKEVTKATYDSTETGKRIITDVELGEVLFDAGKIPFPEYNYEYDIEFLRQENCDRKNEIKAIQLELPKFVKSVNEVRPDPETGNVQLDIPDAYTKQESDDKYQPKGNYAKSVNGITPDENGNITLDIPDAPSLDGYLKASDLKFDLTDYVLKYSVDGGSTWTTIGTTCACEHTPVVTTYSASIVDDTTLADHLYLRTTGSFSEISSLSNLSNGTTVYGKATRSGYEDKTVSGTINGSDLVLRITGDWVKESVDTYIFEIQYTPADANAIVTINGHEGLTYTATAGETIEWSVSAPNYKTQSGSLTMPAEYTRIIVDLVPEEVEPNTFTLTLTSTNTPDDVEYNCTWSTTDPGIHTINGPGVYTLPKDANVSINASCDGYTPIFTSPDVDNPNSFIMIKDTSVNITWEGDGTEYEYEKQLRLSLSNNSYGTNDLEKDVEVGDSVNIYAKLFTRSREVGTDTWSDWDNGVTVTSYVTWSPDGNIISQGSSRLFKAYSGDEGLNFEVTASYYDEVDSINSITFKVAETQETCEITTVTVSPSTASLTVGQTQTLSISTNGNESCNNTVTWTSSDDSIATVDENGKVTAVAAGTVTITATSNDDESVKDECVVTVNEGTPSIISVTGVSLPATESITRYCNGNDDRILLTAVITPSNATNQRVTWSVTNPGTVVSIDPQEGLSCVVEPAQMAGGNATVTVTTEDGNKTASCYITVQDSMIIDIASQEIYRLEKNDSYTLTTTTIPSDASITWNSEDPTCVSVDNGVITGLKLGSSNVTATNNVTGCMDNITITVYDNAEPVIRSLNAANISDTEFEVSMTLGINNGADQTYSVRPLVYAVTDNGNRDTSYLVGSQGDNDEQVDSINGSDFDYTVPYDDMGNREWIYVKAVMSDNPSNYDEDWVRMPAKEN